MHKNKQKKEYHAPLNYNTSFNFILVNDLSRCLWVASEAKSLSSWPPYQIEA